MQATESIKFYWIAIEIVVTLLIIFMNIINHCKKQKELKRKNMFNVKFE